jgi:hypothetical protein
VAGHPANPRAAAAVEVLGAVLSSALTPDEVTDEELHDILLDSATAVLARREGPVVAGS